MKKTSTAEQSNYRRTEPFLETVRSDELATTSRQFSGRDWAAIVTVIVFIVGAWLANFIAFSPVGRDVFDLGLSAVCTAILIGCYGRVLAEHWRGFRATLWRSIGLVLVLVIVLVVLISAVRSILPTNLGTFTPASEPTDVSLATGWVLAFAVLAQLSAVMVAFVEDTTFRHTLLAKIPVWSRPWTNGVVLIVLNAVVFGALHVLNFGGNIVATIPYMVVGLLLNIIFVITRNLWHVLLVHMVFNSSAFIGALVVVVLRAVVGPV